MSSPPDKVPQDDKKQSFEEPSWRIRLELRSDSSRILDLDLNGEIMLGQGKSDENHINLVEFGAQEAGVSREHALLRITDTKLYVTDVGSTNGTYRNGQPISVGSPHSLNNGDIISLGRLQFVVRIIDRPSFPPLAPLPSPVRPGGPTPSLSAHAALHFEPEPDPPDADGRGRSPPHQQ